ncbi:MAG: hypothetical protein JWM25_1359 [Thermoleophilia bacterium]|nr:hypothetical protein [Thermoleophilia bacterium]MCZ4496776.1 hypothetical protein [Thermoleophilia bacterium]
MTVRRLAIVLLLLVVAVTASGCRKVVSNDLVENAIGGVLFSIAGVEVGVTCPENVTMATNNDFFCRTDISGRRGWILVLQHDDYGRMEFRRESPLPPESVEPLIEQFMQRQHGDRVQASCPGNVIEEAGELFTCALDDGREVRVRQVDGVAEFVFNLVGTRDA